MKHEPNRNENDMTKKQNSKTKVSSINPFKHLSFINGVIPVYDIAKISKKLLDEGNIPWSDIHTYLREFYKGNGGMYMSSDLSWILNLNN